MAVRSNITIKGTKDGLVFRLNDGCDWETLLSELNERLDKHAGQFAGPVVHVFVKLGKRVVGEEEKAAIREILKRQGNLLVRSIDGETPPRPPLPREVELRQMTGIVRSGESLQAEGSVLFIGDVNPGGEIVSGGDVYVLGALRGTVHAGAYGDRTAIIAASLMKPIQLRIADVFSRPGDEWARGDAYMEYAYLHNGVMTVDKLSVIGRQRKEVMQFKGVL